MEWGKVAINKVVDHQVILPVSYNTYYNIAFGSRNIHMGASISTYEGENNMYKTLSAFYISTSSTGAAGWSSGGAYWFTIGY